MGAPTSNFSRLVDLAKESSSDTRRDLLREMTDAFMGAPEEHSAAEMEHFDIIMSKVAGEVEAALRKELSERLADVPTAPSKLINQLANDEFEVAEAVLTKSSVLSEEALLSIIEKHGQDHMQAISGREEVSERISDELVARGDDKVLVTLAKNDGARLSRTAMETMVEKSEKITALQGPLVNRRDLSPDLMNDMYFFVSKALRQEILKRTDNLDPALIDKAIRESQAAILRAAGAKAGTDPSAAEKFVRQKIRDREMNEALLSQLIDERREAELVHAFAHLAEVDAKTARRIIGDKSGEAVALACRAAGFDRATLSKILFARSDKNPQLLKLVEQYDKLPVQTAQRVMRFWRVRKQAMEQAEKAA
ncbi:MAG: DUF2336 domain-containing protein [Pseudomonadota bacterium]